MKKNRMKNKYNLIGSIFGSINLGLLILLYIGVIMIDANPDLKSQLMSQINNVVPDSGVDVIGLLKTYLAVLLLLQVIANICGWMGYTKGSRKLIMAALIFSVILAVFMAMSVGFYAVIIVISLIMYIAGVIDQKK
jgi:hypothetical protein